MLTAVNWREANTSSGSIGAVRAPGRPRRRSSSTNQIPASTPRAPLTAARVTPWADASISASVIPVRASAASAAPAMSNRPCAAGLRVSGTCRAVTATTAAASGRLSRKIQRQPTEPTSHPPSSGPTAAATPPRPDQAPIAFGRSSG